MIGTIVISRFLNAAFVVSSVALVSPAAMAQTTNPYLNDLLNQTDQIVQDSYDYINQVEAQQQQQEADLQYGCYTLGDSQSCNQLTQFYQRRIQGYDAGIQYYENLQNNGWADSFGY